jgi:RimJ/RimL family protein N-acetyltransferase
LAAEPELLTARLKLRRWVGTDDEPFAALNADPAVMEYFPHLLTRRQSDDLIDAIERGFEQRGFGLWAVEVRATGAFIGFTGLSEPSYETDFTPAVEVGWRLARAAWGKGYATEAARASLAFGFDHLDLDQIVSFTPVGNTRSRAVMERIGMRRDEEGDFDHPKLPRADPLSRHVLYRIDSARAVRNAEGREGRRDLR